MKRGRRKQKKLRNERRPGVRGETGLARSPSTHTRCARTGCSRRGVGCCTARLGLVPHSLNSARWSLGRWNWGRGPANLGMGLGGGGGARAGGWRC